MKFFIALAVVLTILVLTQAQDESNQAEPSTPEPESPPSDEPSFSIPEKPIRPGIHPFGARPHRNENQGRPQRQPVYFDIIFDFGSGNEIVEDTK